MPRWSAIRHLSATAWPYALLAVLPFIVLWRLWTRNPLDRVFIWLDVTDEIYPFLVFMVDSIRQYHEIPRWAWGIFSGLPFNSSFMNFLLYPLNLPLFLGFFDPSRQGVFHSLTLLHLSIAGISFHLLARSHRYRPVVAFLGACIYMLGGYTTYVVAIGLPWLVVYAWLPLALFCIRKFVVTERATWCVGFALTIFLLVGSLTPLMLIPAIYFAFIYFAVTISIEDRRRRWLFYSVWFAAAIGVGFLLHAVELIPIVESSNVGGAFQFSEYLDARDKWDEPSAFRFLSAFFLGGDCPRPYLSAAGGLAVLAGLWLRRGRYWALWAATLLFSAVAFHFSKDFALYDLAYLFVPGIKLLPALERGGSGLLFHLSAAFLAMGAFTSLGQLRRHSDTIAKVIGAISVALWIVYRPGVPKGLPAFDHSFVAWLVAAAITVLLVTALRLPRNRRAVLVIATALFIVGLTSILSRNFENRLNPLMDAKKPPFKPATDINTETFLQSPYLRGRSSQPKLPSIATPRQNRSRDDNALVQGRDNVAGYYQFVPYRAAQAFSAAGFFDPYIFRGAWATAMDLDLRWPAATVRKLYGLDGAPQGRAWLVPSTQRVTTPPLTAIGAANFDPYKVVLVEPEQRVIENEFKSRATRLQTLLAAPPPDVRPVPRAEVSLPLNDDLLLVRQTPNTAAFRLRRGVQNEFLVFSDTWYPGWIVYVGGQRRPLFVADYTFKAVEIGNAPKDTVVEFVYDPPSTRAGIRASEIALALLLLMALCAVAQQAMHRRKHAESSPPPPLTDASEEPGPAS